MFGTLSIQPKAPLAFVENPDLASVLSRNRRDKPHVSCELCRARKTRCSGEPSGCDKCVALSAECRYPPRDPSARRKKRGHSSINDDAGGNTVQVAVDSGSTSANQDAQQQLQDRSETEQATAHRQRSQRHLRQPRTSASSPVGGGPIESMDVVGLDGADLEANADQQDIEQWLFSNVTSHPVPDPLGASGTQTDMGDWPDMTTLLDPALSAHPDVFGDDVDVLHDPQNDPPLDDMEFPCTVDEGDLQNLPLRRRAMSTLSVLPIKTSPGDSLATPIQQPRQLQPQPQLQQHHHHHHQQQQQQPKQYQHQHQHQQPQATQAPSRSVSRSSDGNMDQQHHQQRSQHHHHASLDSPGYAPVGSNAGWSSVSHMKFNRTRRAGTLDSRRKPPPASSSSASSSGRPSAATRRRTLGPESSTCTISHAPAKTEATTASATSTPSNTSNTSHTFPPLANSSTATSATSCPCLSHTILLLEELGAKHAADHPASMDIMLSFLRSALSHCTAALDCDRCQGQGETNILVAVACQYMTIMYERVVRACVRMLETKIVSRQQQPQQQQQQGGAPGSAASASSRSNAVGSASVSSFALSSSLPSSGRALVAVPDDGDSVGTTSNDPSSDAADDMWFSTYRIESDCERMHVLTTLVTVQSTEFARLLGRVRTRVGGSPTGHCRMKILTEAENRTNIMRRMLKSSLDRAIASKSDDL